MATQIACDTCGQESAALMQTNLDNGETVAIGSSCMFEFFCVFIATMADGMDTETRHAHTGAAPMLFSALAAIAAEFDEMTPYPEAAREAERIAHREQEDGAADVQ